MKKSLLMIQIGLYFYSFTTLYSMENDKRDQTLANVANPSSVVFPQTSNVALKRFQQEFSDNKTRLDQQRNEFNRFLKQSDRPLEVSKIDLSMLDRLILNREPLSLNDISNYNQKRDEVFKQSVIAKVSGQNCSDSDTAALPPKPSDKQRDKKNNSLVAPLLKQVNDIILEELSNNADKAALPTKQADALNKEEEVKQQFKQLALPLEPSYEKNVAQIRYDFDKQCEQFTMQFKQNTNNAYLKSLPLFDNTRPSELSEEPHNAKILSNNPDNAQETNNRSPLKFLSARNRRNRDTTSPDQKIEQLEACYQQIKDAQENTKNIATAHEGLSDLLQELEHDYEPDENVFNNKDFFKEGEQHLHDLSCEYDKQKTTYDHTIHKMHSTFKKFDKQIKQLLDTQKKADEYIPAMFDPFARDQQKEKAEKLEKLIERRKQLEQYAQKIIDQREAQLEAMAVPDDIVPAGTWITQHNTSDTMPRTYGKLRRLDTYIPHNMSNKKISAKDAVEWVAMDSTFGSETEGYFSDKDTVAWVVMHGTWGSGTEAYFKDKGVNERNQNYRHMKRAAAWYAFTHKKRVDLLSYKWTGLTFESDRREIAKVVAKQLNTEYKNSDVILSGHSHGCNVNNQITHRLNKPAKLLLYFACPVRQGQPTNLPEKFEQMLYFYSEGDPVARIGRIYDYKLNSALGALLVPIPLTASRFFCIEILKQIGFDIEFRNTIIEGSAAVGAMAITGLSLEYMRRASLPGSHKFPILPTYNNNIINGFETTINGEQAGHSEVPNMIQFLPEIITQLHRKYPAHYGNNALFTIDGRMNETLILKKPKPVLLAINNALPDAADNNFIVGKAPKIPFIIKHIPYIKTESDMTNKDTILFYDEHNDAKKQNPVKLIGPDYYTKFSMIENNFDQRDISRENLYSNSQKELLKQLYIKKKKLKKIL